MIPNWGLVLGTNQNENQWPGYNGFNLGNTQMSTQGIDQLLLLDCLRERLLLYFILLSKVVANVTR